ncbi:hypothetical protein K2P96_01545, partial [Patescibacteria group bacterium]|nr:hypothetical protein [Patescibacteria group bacterium]
MGKKQHPTSVMVCETTPLTDQTFLSPDTAEHEVVGVAPRRVYSVANPEPAFASSMDNSDDQQEFRRLAKEVCGIAKGPNSPRLRRRAAGVSHELKGNLDDPRWPAFKKLGI